MALVTGILSLSAFNMNSKFVQEAEIKFVQEAEIKFVQEAEIEHGRTAMLAMPNFLLRTYLYKYPRADYYLLLDNRTFHD